jgi:hypothetical protein
MHDMKLNSHFGHYLIIQIRVLTYVEIYHLNKAELLQLNRTHFTSLGFFISKKVGNRKN